MTDLEKLRLLDILLKEFEILDYVNETQFDVELDENERSLVNKILKERGYKVFEDEDQEEAICVVSFFLLTALLNYIRVLKKFNILTTVVYYIIRNKNGVSQK